MTPAQGFAEMKDSGITWIGEIPAHWSTTRMKSILENITVKNHPDAEVLSLYREYGVLPKNSRDDNHNVTSQDTTQYKYVEVGDLVINKMKAWQGSLAVSGYEGIVSPAYYVCKFRSEKVNKDYIHFLLRCSAYAQEFERLSTGMRIGQWDLGISDFMRVPALLPPLSEQFSIASYLDTQCAKIDEIVTQAKASIEEYKQWKASIIYEAVTKGLDPNVEMKGSGIFWIGDIPKHWKLDKLKRFSSMLTPMRDKPERLDGEIPWIRIEDYDGKYISTSKEGLGVSHKTVEKMNLKVYPVGTILCTSSCDLGKCAIVSKELVSNQRFIGIIPNEVTCPDYLYYLMLSNSERLNYLSTGSIQANLSRVSFEQLYVQMPPLEEQKEISHYLDKKCSQVNELIAEKQSLINDLESLKKSLIYEVVTGKRSVEDTNQMTIAILSPEIMRYRKALLMLRVLDLLGTGVRGRIQLQKCMFAAECLLNMPFQTQFIRYEHGPYDPDLLNIEEIINAKGWYTVLKGSPVSYHKGKQFEEGLREYMDTFSDIDQKLEKIVDFLRPMKTSQAERIATLLAAWNDFIIDGVSHPTDKEIIGEVVTNWTPNKANPQYSTWQDTLYKMREHRFVPKGSGVHTLQKEA